MAQEMDAHVYALSVARRIKNYAARMPLNYAKEKSDLQLLDYIALLLVTDDKGDVAAVAMEQLPNAVIFYYSKNAPCSPQFHEYLQRLLTICASAEGDDFIPDFLTEVFKNCRQKIKNRLNKCKKAIKPFENIEFDDEVAARVPQAANVRASWLGKSFGEIVKAFLTSLGDYEIQPHKGGSISASIRLCMEAFYIGREPGLLRYPTLERRIKKLGDYFGAARRFGALFMNPRLTHLRGSISMREIRPTQPRLVEVTENVVQILNDHAEKAGYENIDAAAFMARFEQPVQENGRPQKITVSSHCELTLALHFYETMTRSKHFMEMGVSKGCCWLCEQFLDTLSQQEKQVVVEVSHNQGKIHAGWGMPDKTPSSVAEKMLQIIDQELCDIQATVLAHRKSDSFPTDADLDLAPSERGIFDRIGAKLDAKAE